MRTGEDLVVEAFSDFIHTIVPHTQAFIKHSIIDWKAESSERDADSCRLARDVSITLRLLPELMTKQLFLEFRQRGMKLLSFLRRFQKDVQIAAEFEVPMGLQDLIVALGTVWIRRSLSR